MSCCATGGNDPHNSMHSTVVLVSSNYSQTQYQVYTASKHGIHSQNMSGCVCQLCTKTSPPLNGVYRCQSAGVLSPFAAASISAEFCQEPCMGFLCRHICTHHDPIGMLETLAVHASKKQTKTKVCASWQSPQQVEAAAQTACFQYIHTV